MCVFIVFSMVVIIMLTAVPPLRSVSTHSGVCVDPGKALFMFCLYLRDYFFRHCFSITNVKRKWYFKPTDKRMNLTLVQP